jgi:uncharacterized membrane protein HdeD (DUF308 family)
MTTADDFVGPDIGRWWWMWLVAGFIWIMAALVILQLDESSARTVGVIIGIMLFVAGAQYMGVGAVAEGWRWLWFAFAILLMAAGFTAMLNPVEAFAGLADMLGFLFGLVAIIWLIEALATKDVNPFWWLNMLSGILMLLVAFWAAGQFLIDKAYTLLVFAGIWAMMKGILDIIQAFNIRRLGRISARF